MIRALNFHGLLVLAVAIGAFAAVEIGCAGPEAGSISFGEGESEGSSGDPGDGKTTNGATVPSGSSSSGGSTSSGDPPAGGGAAPFGAAAFTAGTPENGPAKGKTTHTMNATNDPSGVACMGCHTATFAFGGTVYSTAAGGAPVAGAQIIVSAPDGTAYATAYSDNDGNFWVAKPVTGTLPADARVGVRNAGKSKIMTGKLGATGTDCNSAGCHGNAALRVFLD